MNHLFTTSTHDIAGVFFERISQPENWTHVFLLLHGMLGSLWQLLCKNLATFTQNTQNLQPLLLIKKLSSQCKSNPRGCGLPYAFTCIYHSKGFVPKWLEITKHPRGLPIPEWYLNPKPYETPTKTNQGQPAPQDTPLLQPTRYHRLQATAYLTRWLKN